MTCFAQIIDRWPTLPEFAREVGVERAVAYHWLHRDSIPAEWFLAVVRAAQARGFADVTAESLAGMAEARRRARDAEGSSDGAAA